MRTTMKYLVIFLVGAGINVQAAVPNIEDGFELYAVGTQFFDAAVMGWRASSASVVVTNAGGFSGQAVMMHGQSVLTNNLGGGIGATVVWTEVMLNPVIGEAPPAPPTNSASYGCYFNSNGYIVMYNRDVGSQVCSNDVWGHAVSPATNGYVRVSIYQDFGLAKVAVFLDGQLLLQDLPFVGSAADYNKLLINNCDNNAWLDDVWIKPSRNASVLTNDFNSNGMADSQELVDYHYVARTLYVGGAGIPCYGTIQEAVNIARPRDSIYICEGVYHEAVTVTGAVEFVGKDFSLTGLNVAQGALVSFTQMVTIGTANISGIMNFSSGAACSVSSAMVVGPIGRLNFESNSTFTASYTGVHMIGGFVISNTWNTSAIKQLSFFDDFELYANATPLSALSFQGWYASSDEVKVMDSAGRNASKGVRLPQTTVLSNRIDRAATTKIWTDVWITPVLGDVPTHFPSNNASFSAYVNESGWLVVYTNGGFKVCSNAWDGSVLAPMTTNNFSRITIFQDMTEARFAVFIGGKLILEQASFPGGNNYTSFKVDNREGCTLVDDVLITTGIPSGLDSPDAQAIAICGSIRTRGSVFLLR